MRLWTQARQMGAYAGQCLIHSWKDETMKKELDFCFEMFTHATKFFGYKVILLGLFTAQGLDVKDYEVLLRVTRKKEYIKVILKGELRYNLINACQVSKWLLSKLSLYIEYAVTSH